VGVLAGEIDEGLFIAALGDGNLDLVAGALSEQSGECLAVVEVDRDEDGARNVLLVDVELLEERGEDVACVEGGFIRCRAVPRPRIGTWGTRDSCWVERGVLRIVLSHPFGGETAEWMGHGVELPICRLAAYGR
jgi:hypothetical protein